MSRLFDPVDLMNQPIEANATKRDPLPIGETVAQITELKFSSGTSNKPGKPSMEWTRLDCTLELTDPEYVSQIPGNTSGKAITFLGIMLDMNGQQIAVGPNKNIRLGKLREAAGVNGQPLNMLVGQYIRIQVSQKPHPTDPDSGPISEITSYTKVE